MPAPVRTGPRFATPESLLKPPYPQAKLRLEEEAVLRLRLVDADSGELIAEPRFYQRAHGIFAGYSLGAADKLMLARLSDMAAAYLRDNFYAPRGSTVATSTAKMD